MPIGQKLTMLKLMYFYLNTAEPIRQKFTLIDGGIYN